MTDKELDRLTEVQRELSECREKLAAAEAREREYRRVIKEALEKLDGVEGVTEWVTKSDCAKSLKQARGFRDAWKAKAKELREELNTLLRGIEHPGGLLASAFDDGKREGAAEQLEPMSCGHPKAAAAYRDDDVFLCCAWCVSENNARRESKREGAAEERERLRYEVGDLLDQVKLWDVNGMPSMWTAEAVKEHTQDILRQVLRRTQAIRETDEAGDG